ncbi:hypothetical protein GGI19_000932 [Coemansia pectinata]|uniref:HD domain-containing protein n=1 Tax=Coemansia pectinata TaxID=1052879 RepID=A0A9W8GZ52_9FUNG|nr:hypothetical protein GGI19_000932 [Coemansia pectinata]
MPTTMFLEQRVTTVFELLENAGKKEHIGGKITRLDHALQVAQLAKSEGADEETILAALFYDIGHLCLSTEQRRDVCDKNFLSYHLTNTTRNTSAIDYGRIGGEYLRQFGFPKKTCELIESDVMARRYILTVDPQRLITPAVVSVVYESYRAGPLSSTEMREFENDPLFKQKVQLRRWSYFVKVVEGYLATLDTYRDMAIRNMPI